MLWQLSQPPLTLLIIKSHRQWGEWIAVWCMCQTQGCFGMLLATPVQVHFGNSQRLFHKEKPSISASDISTHSAAALKSVTANISPKSLLSSAKTTSANEQAGGHIHTCVSITFVLFSFSCLGNFFWFVFVCLAFLCSKSPVDDRLGSVTWPAEVELPDPTGRTQAARSASSNLCF